MKRGKLILGIVLLIIGVFYSFLPHAIYIASGIGFGFSHTVHVTIGIIALVIGVLLVIWRK